MRIPKKMLDVLLRNPEVKIRSRERKIITKFNVHIPIGSAVWVEVGKKLHIIHALNGDSKCEVLTDELEARRCWTKRILELNDRSKEHLQALNEEYVGTKIPPTKHWWGEVGFSVNGKLTDVFWSEDGSKKYKCPSCDRLMDAYVLPDIPGIEDHIATRIFDPAHDLEERFEEGGSRGTDCQCNPGKYWETKCIAIFNKKLLNAANKARRRFWKGIEDRFGKNRFERDNYLESAEYQEDRQKIINTLFLRFKRQPYERRGTRVR